MSANSSGRKRLLDKLIRSTTPQCHNNWPWFYLIDAIQQRSNVLSTKAYIHNHRTSWSTHDFLRAVAAMSLRYGMRVRSPWDWSPGGGHPIQSLSNHLFAAYPVADFLHRAWLEDERAQNMLIGLGGGQKVRQASCNHYDAKLTRKAAHQFTTAPNRLGVFDTLRWSQLRADGCSDRLAIELVEATKLVEDIRRHKFPHDFWLEMCAFLRKAKSVVPRNRERSTVAPDFAEMFDIAEFAYQQKYDDPSRVLGYRVDSESPLQPDFTFRGRTLRSLRNHMMNWKNEVTLPKKKVWQPARKWDSAGLQSISFEFDSARWQIIEITNFAELHREGSMMSNCVASYHHCCTKGISSIWSLRRIVGPNTTHQVTIEFEPSSRSIVQAKAKHNEEPEPFHKALIRHWAEVNEIRVAI